MNPISKKFKIPIFGFVLLLSLLPTLASAAPKSELIKFWVQSDESNSERINHDDWQQILDHYVLDMHPSRINRFNYGGITEEHKQLLQQYIKKMKSRDPRKLARIEQKSYWINLYNALTVNLVSEAFPIESIKKLGKGFFSFGPWDDEITNIQGQTLTLNNIEHGILRPIWKDNRIHYAVNCASLGCPNLQKQAYTSENSDKLLDQAARDYINHSRGVRFEGNKLIVSSIYHWYREDFGKSDANVIKHLINYAEPRLKQQLSTHSGGFTDAYDWQLNSL